VSEGRLQLRIDAELKKKALSAAKRRHTTLSAIVAQYLQCMVDIDELERQIGLGTDVEQV